jgi:hypothetical protein
MVGVISSPWRGSADARPARPGADCHGLALEEAGQLEPAAVLERLGTATADSTRRRPHAAWPKVSRTRCGATGPARSRSSRQLENPLLLLRPPVPHPPWMEHPG